MMSKIHVGSNKKMSQLPIWLSPNSNVLSPLYKRVWEAVQDDCSKPRTILGEVLVDTNKIFPLLLTSQLSTEILGYIWSLANQKYAGQLTEQELYIVLALVALAQASYPFNSLEVLYYIRFPPIPNLNLSILDINTSKNELKVHVSPFESPSVNSFNTTNKKYGNLSKFSNKSVSLNNDEFSYNYNQSDNLKDDKFSSVHVSHNAIMMHNDHQNLYNQSDVKTDIKHPSSSSSIDFSDDFSDFQSAPVSNAPIIPNILDIKQGSAIGSRLANHNLGVKKLNDKIKKTGLNKNNNNNQVRQIATSNSILQNREIQCNDRLSELFPKCTIKNQAKTVILKDTAIRNNNSVDMIKSNIKGLTSSMENIIKDNINILSKSTCPKNIDSTYIIPLKVLKQDSIQQDLMSMQPTEDKYSALRALVDEPSNLSNLKSNEKTSICLSVDDFGEFVSAKDLKTETIIGNSNTNTSIDLLSDFNLDSESIIGTNSKSHISLIQEISDAFNALTCEEIVDQQIEEKFDVRLHTEKVVQKEDCLSVNSIESAPVAEFLTRSGSVPSLDLKSFLPSSQDDEQQIENMHQMIYWEWKHYMESCVLLLQVAASIFTSITSEIVLREVLSSAQGYNFLCNLAEVAAVCRRVNFSHKEMDINIMGFDDLLMEIDRIWSEMEPFYSNIPIVTELPAWPLHPGDGITCMLCMTIITHGRVVFNDNNYHATCANLWLHTVNSNLPVLRYPVF